ncbi:hypothetical protein [Thalassoglobus neptunius]|uniref:hypothetical protein n=1 Tax=Thalassoglobus neptunius TaxID=1938619 RepID=UPI0011B7F40A|nr:hypothetical protein [Thalassoglobus neptunius]
MGTPNAIGYATGQSCPVERSEPIARDRESMAIGSDGEMGEKAIRGLGDQREHASISISPFALAGETGD